MCAAFVRRRGAPMRLLSRSGQTHAAEYIYTGVVSRDAQFRAPGVHPYALALFLSTLSCPSLSHEFQEQVLSQPLLGIPLAYWHSYVTLHKLCISIVHMPVLEPSTYSSLCSSPCGPATSLLLALSGTALAYSCDQVYQKDRGMVRGDEDPQSAAAQFLSGGGGATPHTQEAGRNPTC